MQSASDNFTRAATGADRQVATRLLIDWWGDGSPDPGTGPQLFRDTFDRDAASSWGLTWVNTNGAASDYNVVATGGVAGGVGSQSMTSVNDIRRSLLTFGHTDQETVVEFSVPVVAAGGAITVWSVVRVTDTSNHYIARWAGNTDGTVTLALFRRVAGTLSGVLATATAPGTHVAGARWRIRAQISGTTLKARTWLAAREEPMGWQVEVEDTTAALAAGTGIGVLSRLEAGNSNTLPVTISFTEVRAVGPDIDHWSERLGDWQVDHHLDDGLPDAVSFVSGIAVAELGATVSRPKYVTTPALAKGRSDMTAEAYFSQYQQNSPLYGYDRDTVPLTLDVGFVGKDAAGRAAGPERIRIFTGQMSDLQNGEISAVSTARQKLAAFVQPPAVYGLYEGANATWLVSYVLAACGIYASPPPQVGCRWWNPFHGSIRPFFPSDNIDQINAVVFTNQQRADGNPASGHQGVVDMEWFDGPFVSGGPFVANVNGLTQSTSDVDGLIFADGADLISQAGNKGKVEFWARGDAMDSTGTSSWTRMQIENNDTSRVDLGIRSLSTPRALYLNVFDGTHSTDINNHSVVLPEDGAWHFCGFAWNFTKGKVWINLDGAVESFTLVNSVLAEFPATDDWNPIFPTFTSSRPVSELQVTSGANADPDDAPWLLDIPFTPGAIITPSSMNFFSIAERQPREAWELLSSLAQAELAMLRTDENDIVQYLGFRHWGQAAQQIILDDLSTARNLGTLKVSRDPTKVRNSARVSYTEVRNVDVYGSVLATQDIYEIKPGTTILTLATDGTPVELRGFTFTYVVSGDTTEPVTVNFVTLNSSAAGTGVYATSAQVSVTVDEWTPGQVVVRFVNATSTVWYTANNKTWATINIAAKSLVTLTNYAQASSANSIARRSERGLPVDLPVIQRRKDALRTAVRLKNALRRPRPTAEQILVRGDSRRQPGDLVSLSDRETGVSGNWRVQSVRHIDQGGLYSQELRLRQVEPTATWGDGVSRWGSVIWSDGG